MLTGLALGGAPLLAHAKGMNGCLNGNCDPETPPQSTGTPREQAQAKAVVLRSQQFRDHAREQIRLVRGHFDVPSAIVGVDGDFATVVISSAVKARSVVLQFWVNLAERTVVEVTELVLLDAGNNSAHVVLSDERGVINDIVVSNDNVQTATGEQFSPEGYLEYLKQQNAYSTFVSCDTIVIGLCGAGGAGACFAVCIALTLTTGPGGLACAVVCGIIAAYGCAEAQRRICG